MAICGHLPFYDVGKGHLVFKMHKYMYQFEDITMHKKITIRGLNVEAWKMLVELREVERRQTGAVLEDCIRYYYENYFDDE